MSDKKLEEISLADLESMLVENPNLIDNVEISGAIDPEKYLEEQIKMEIKAASKRIKYIRNATTKDKEEKKYYLQLWASLIREVYQSLVDEGFSPKESMELTKAVVGKIGIL